MRVEAEDGATDEVGGVVAALLDDADVEVAVLHRGREVPLWWGARIASHWLAGTSPRKTSVSVPRLTPE